MPSNLGSQLLMSNPTRAQSSLNAYGAGHKSVDPKQRRLSKFVKLQQMFYESQVDEIDLSDVKNPQACAEYAVEIYEHMK